MPNAESPGRFFRRAASNRAPCWSPEASPAEMRSFKKTRLIQVVSQSPRSVASSEILKSVR